MIGIFDSGVGGLTVLRELKRHVPSESLVYFGDTARVPWGNKSPQAIQNYAGEITEFLISKGAKRIVIACNTASALAAKQLRTKYNQILFYDVISPCVARVAGDKAKSVLIIGTKGTIGSKAYERSLRRRRFTGKIHSQACPLFVPFIEEGMQNSKLLLEIADKYLKKFKKQKIEQLVLGCTHYPLMKANLRAVFGSEVAIIDSALEVAKVVASDIKGEKNDKGKKDSLYFSDWSKHNESFAKRIVGAGYGIKIQRF